MSKRDFRFLLSVFLTWRVLLFVFLFVAISVVPLQKNFLGGGLANYLSAPYFWAWANFDGEHYLSIAQNGYGQGEQAFFPAYPFFIRILAKPFGGSLVSLGWVGLLIANISFFLALYGFYKLIRLDYKERIAKLTIILLLLFPTSFYFASVYTESLFLALVIWSFYFARKKKWWAAIILAGISSSTRFVGILLFPILALEMWSGRKKRFSLKYYLPLVLAPLGLLAYTYFLKVDTGDPLAFIHTLSGFGEQRSVTPIPLPQVFYRYIFKILPNVNYSFFPVAFTSVLEFLLGLGFLVLSVIAFFRLRLSYALFLAGGYLIPTLTGSFSSLPRYVLVLFPTFILSALWLSKKPRWLQSGLLLTLLILLGIATALFVRGFWVA